MPIGLQSLTPQAGGLSFNLIYSPNIDPRALAGFQQAAGTWSSYLTTNTPTVVNINIGFSPLPAGVIGSTSSTQVLTNYSDVHTLLQYGETSQDDAQAVASLPNGSSVGLLMNGTANDPNGAGSRVPYVDNNGSANNSTVRMTSANAKAMGFTVTGAASDASITFSSAFAFDFDPSDGIDSNKIDFVGTATHEIGHALGFISGVDILDGNSKAPNFFSDNAFTYVSPVDLFRFSTPSAALGVRDFTLGDQGSGQVDQYFSLDGGQTKIASFSTGQNYGNGYQASHWQQNPIGTTPIGIMAPAVAYGQKDVVSATDLRLFDAIGYTLRPAAVPESSTLWLLLPGAGLLVWAARRRRTVAAF